MANPPTQFILKCVIWLWFHEEYKSALVFLHPMLVKYLWEWDWISNPMSLTQLQMTGLDIERDQIIEMACIITDSDLNILAEVKHLHNCNKVGYSLHRYKDA